MSYLDARGHKVPSGTDLASRQSLLDLSLSIGDIKTVASQSAAQDYVNKLKSAGVTASADNRIYVDVGGRLRVYDGHVWRDLRAGPQVYVTKWTSSSKSNYIDASVGFGRTFVAAPLVWMQNIGEHTLRLGRVMFVTATSASIQVQTPDGSALGDLKWNVYQYGSLM